MKCKTCQDTLTVQDMSGFGTIVTTPCPSCNKDGEKGRKESERLSQEIRKKLAEL